jgi:metallo-beta-lactamase family protein
MNIRFLGAAQGVTGSMHLLETSRGSVLVDCGLFQGRRDESRQRNRELPREATAADAVVLTHAHIDHSGNLPHLVKSGFAGTIFTTPASRDLCAHMLRDSARIQRADADYLNRKFGEDPGWKRIDPLYTEEDAIAALGRFVCVPYHKRFEVLPGIWAELFDAGHILGSAGLAIELEEHGKTHRLVFSGDIGRRGLPILRDPEIPGRADYAVMESTYGDKTHADVHSMNDSLERVVKETILRNGKILIPAFSVGRTQEVVYTLNQLTRAGKLPAIPVFIDSPLAINVTEVFKLHPECYDAETRAFLEAEGNPFEFAQLRYVQSREESIRLNSLREPAIIIASSGMCEAGRILHHLKNSVEDERNTIVIVGFQAQHTLGRRLVERRPRVRILGIERELHARVEVLNAFSAHGDRNDLDLYARGLGEGLRRLFLVHGEPEQQEPFAKRLRAAGRQVVVPAPGEVAEL